MAKNFDLQDDTKLAYEVQKYKWHLFSFSRIISFTQTKLSFV